MFPQIYLSCPSDFPNRFSTFIGLRSHRSPICTSGLSLPFTGTSIWLWTCAQHFQGSAYESSSTIRVCTPPHRSENPRGHSQLCGTKSLPLKGCNYPVWDSLEPTRLPNNEMKYDNIRARLLLICGSLSWHYSHLDLVTGNVSRWW